MLVLFWLVVFAACQSDTPQSGNNAGNETESIEGQGQTEATAPDPEKQKAALLDRVKRLTSEVNVYKQTLRSLQEEIDAVPEANKKRVLDYEDLIARLEGYGEKSEYVGSEAERILAILEGKAEVPLTSDGGSGDVPDPGMMLDEQESGMAELNEAMTTLKQGVEKLKGANGDKIQLFTAEK